LAHTDLGHALPAPLREELAERKVFDGEDERSVGVGGHAELADGRVEHVALAEGSVDTTRHVADRALLPQAVAFVIPALLELHVVVDEQLAGPPQCRDEHPDLVLRRLLDVDDSLAEDHPLRCVTDAAHPLDDAAHEHPVGDAGDDRGQDDAGDRHDDDLGTAIVESAARRGKKCVRTLTERVEALDHGAVLCGDVSHRLRRLGRWRGLVGGHHSVQDGQQLAGGVGEGSGLISDGAAVSFLDQRLQPGVVRTCHRIPGRRRALQTCGARR